MKVKAVRINNRRRAFEVRLLSNRTYSFPFSRCAPRPTAEDRVRRVYVDAEVANEGFTYELASGQEGTVLADHVLDYNRDPSYMRDLLLYRLTLKVLDELETSGISRREIIKRLGTSPAQFYRLLDTTNYRKSIDQLVRLLEVLGCEIEFRVQKHHNRTPARIAGVGSAADLAASNPVAASARPRRK